MFDRNSSRGRNGHRSSSGFDTIDPSGFRIDDRLGARGSSRGVITSTTTGPGASSSVSDAVDEAAIRVDAGVRKAVGLDHRRAAAAG